MKGDRYKILNDKGELCGYGFGYENLQPGERFEEIDTAEDLEADPDVRKAKAQAAATGHIGLRKIEDRSQAFALKSLCADRFLAEVPDVGVAGQPELINSDLYYPLYIEYKTTYLLMKDVTPWDLARSQQAKSREVIDSETLRRDDILINEAYLDTQQ